MYIIPQVQFISCVYPWKFARTRWFEIINRIIRLYLYITVHTIVDCFSVLSIKFFSRGLLIIIILHLFASHQQTSKQIYDWVIDIIMTGWWGPYHVTYEPDSANSPAVDSISLGRRCLVVAISNSVNAIGLVCTAWLYQSGIQLFISFGNNSGLFTAQIAQNMTHTSCAYHHHKIVLFIDCYTFITIFCHI